MSPLPATSTASGPTMLRDGSWRKPTKRPGLKAGPVCRLADILHENRASGIASLNKAIGKP